MRFAPANIGFLPHTKVPLPHSGGPGKLSVWIRENCPEPGLQKHGETSMITGFYGYLGGLMQAGAILVLRPHPEKLASLDSFSQGPILAFRFEILKHPEQRSGNGIIRDAATLARSRQFSQRCIHAELEELADTQTPPCDDSPRYQSPPRCRSFRWRTPREWLREAPAVSPRCRIGDPPVSPDPPPRGFS